ncbi:Rha family transcriptional regulator, partial [Burkholderia gladioli]
MSSIEIADLCEKQHAHVIRDIRVMVEALEDDPNLDHVRETKDARGYTSKFDLPKDLTLTLVAGYNVKLRKRIIDRWLELESEVAKRAPPLSPAQMFLQTAQLMADIEARQFAQAEAVARVEQRIEDLSETRAFTSCPSNAEPITHIRKRIGEEYGLSAKVVDQILRQSPYAPKPTGEVKNPHEEAQGATYTVWWTKDVSAVFKRVAAEAVQVTDAQYTHPYIEGRFKVRGRKPEKGPPSRGDLFEPESPP